MTISYRQPYLRKEGEARLFYVPIFKNLPIDISTTDTNHYSVTFTTAKDCSVIVTSGEQRVEAQAGHSVILAPTHHQAIKATTTTQADVDIQRSGAKWIATPPDSARDH